VEPGKSELEQTEIYAICGAKPKKKKEKKKGYKKNQKKKNLAPVKKSQSPNKRNFNGW